MNLPDALLDEVRQQATAADRTVTSVVEEALRQWLAQHERSKRERPEYPLRVFDGGPGDHLLVDLEDKEALWAILEADDIEKMRRSSER